MKQESFLLPVLYSLSSDGDLLLMDEPFTNLTYKEREMLTNILVTAS